MRNTCAQARICGWCGVNIERFTPRQQWMDFGGTNTICRLSPDKRHKPEPLEERNDHEISS